MSSIGLTMAFFMSVASPTPQDIAPGISKALAEKLHEIASTGKLGYYEKLRAEFPESIFDLFELSQT